MRTRVLARSLPRETQLAQLHCCHRATFPPTCCCHLGSILSPHDHSETPHNSIGSLKAAPQAEKQPLRTNYVRANKFGDRFGKAEIWPNKNYNERGSELGSASGVQIFFPAHSPLHISDCKCNHRQICLPSFFLLQIDHFLPKIVLLLFSWDRCRHS